MVSHVKEKGDGRKAEKRNKQLQLKSEYVMQDFIFISRNIMENKNQREAEGESPGKLHLISFLRQIYVPQVAQLVKNPPANAEDACLNPGSGRSSAEGNGNPLHYSCLENGQKSLVGYSPGGWVPKSQT